MIFIVDSAPEFLDLIPCMEKGISTHGKGRRQGEEQQQERGNVPLSFSSLVL